jgi:hypothetical protein
MHAFATLILAVSLTFSGCEKGVKLTTFNIDETTSITIPSSIGLDVATNLNTPPIDSESESEFEGNDTRKDLIDEVTLLQLELTITSPNSGNFDFLKSLEIFISADGLEEQRIAYRTEIPNDNSKTLRLIAENVKLKTYIQEDTYKLRVKMNTDKTITQDHKIDIYTELQVDASLIN